MGSRYKRVEQSLPGTCKWIFQNSQYLEWLAAGTSEIRRGFLWIKGKAGSGKSTLMKAIVQNIRSLPSHPVVIRFFFDARGNLLERSPLGLFRTLIKELFHERPHLIEQFLPLYRDMLEAREGGWRMPDLYHWFRQSMEKQELGPVYVFIDALDECDEEEVDPRTSRDHDTNARTLVRFFERLMTPPTEPANPLLLCLSSRHYPHITVRNDIKYFELAMEDENDQDIRKFIKSALASSSLDTGLMQDDLYDMITHRSRGVFLWVVLVIQALSRARDQGRPRSHWKAILEGIPTTLNDIFCQIMDNLKDEDRVESAILFQLLIFGKESMSLECLRHAFGFAVDDPPASLEIWRCSDNYLQEEAFIRRIRDLSCGLVEVKDGRTQGIQTTQQSQETMPKTWFGNAVNFGDALSFGDTNPRIYNNREFPDLGRKILTTEYQVVQFIHETVRTFFVKGHYTRLASLQQNVGGPLSGRPHTPGRGVGEVGKAHTIVIQACLSYMAAASEVLDALDREFDVVQNPTPNAPVSIRSHFVGDLLFSRMPFLKFAGRWLRDYMENLAAKSLEKPQIELYEVLGGPSNKTFAAWKAVYYSVDLKEERGESNYYIRTQADFFDYAAIHGLSYSVSAGLKDCSGAGPRTLFGVTPLMRLLSYQCDNGARVLVAQGMSVNARDDLGRSVLFYAQSLEMIEMLLDAGAEVNGIWIPRLADTAEAYEPESNGIGLNALMYYIGDAEIVECLIRHGANVEEQSITGKKALDYAYSAAVATLILAKRQDLQTRYGF
jgi:hypothetical protein